MNHISTLLINIIILKEYLLLHTLVIVFMFSLPININYFFICLLIAYDEILTTKSYATDHELYLSFGHPAFFEWIKQVTRDEAYHFHNAMEVIRLRHSNRINEIPETIELMLNWDLQKNEYAGTFVLDHDWYSEEFLNWGASVIRNYFK